jgi:hypothetical protein
VTTTQSFKIYEILQRHFNNKDDAKIVVPEIEQIIEAKLESKSNLLSTKEDISTLKRDLLKFQIEVEKRFNNNIIWIVSTGIAVVGLILSIIKIFLIK